jgi:hypothetical protein
MQRMRSVCARERLTEKKQKKRNSEKSVHYPRMQRMRSECACERLTEKKKF